MFDELDLTERIRMFEALLYNDWVRTEKKVATLQQKKKELEAKVEELNAEAKKAKAEEEKAKAEEERTKAEAREMQTLQKSVVALHQNGFLPKVIAELLDTSIEMVETLLGIKK